jgi:cellulose synthase/poly-beta-1,6-N-acetylglucosamine synthase-like glycosyltransferase
VDALFWILIGLSLYAYAGYPLLLWVATRLRGGAPGGTAPAMASWPRVSVMLPAYNEAAVIEARIRNLLALDYPAGRIEIIVGSDASGDRTAEIARGFSASGVRLVEAEHRSGKTALLNRMLERASGEVIAYTDANCAWEPEALKRLVAHFADPSVGCVIGELRYVNDDEPAVAGGEGLYWRYENAVKEMESRLGGTLVANGSIYALRRSLARPLPAEISDDSVNPLLVLRDGYRVRFERRAVAREKAAKRLGEEFRRKARMVTRQLGTLMHVRGFLSPFHPVLAFRLLSHKLLRWQVPVLLIAAGIVNLLLLDRGLFQWTLLGGILFLLLAAAGGWRVARGRAAPVWMRLPAYFCVVNAAALKGTADFLLGRRRAVWRVSESTR